MSTCTENRIQVNAIVDADGDEDFNRLSDLKGLYIVTCVHLAMEVQFPEDRAMYMQQ